MYKVLEFLFYFKISYVKKNLENDIEYYRIYEVIFIFFFSGEEYCSRVIFVEEAI